MNMHYRIQLSAVFLCLLLAVVAAGPASATTTFNMAAGQTTMTMPGGEIVPMWGFSLISTNTNGVVTPGDGIVKVPGEPLVVPPGETTVTINLTNNLPEPVSLMILGQSLQPASGPVWTDGLSSTVSATGSRVAGDLTSRVRSFAHETPAGGVASYTWTNFRTGTYLLQSGTNPAKQVQMGLYAAIKKDSGAGEAYPGVAYDKELILVYSEIDPVINAAIGGGTYGPGGVITSSLHRVPKYFLINGMAYDSALPGGLDPLNDIALGTNDRILLRLLNAGYNLHVPELMNNYLAIVAEDGNPYPYSRSQYSVALPAAKTMDVILEPSGAGAFKLYDAAMGLTNAGDASPGGMLASLDIIASCLSDINSDGAVNISDFGILSAAFGSSPGSPNWNSMADINTDGVVNISDFGILSSEFGRNNCP